MLRTGMLGLALYLAFTVAIRRPISVRVSLTIPSPTAPTAPTPAPAPAPTPAPTPRPQPPPTPPAATDPCPAPFTSSASGASGMAAELHAPADIDALTPSSHDVRLLAAWSRDAVHVSADEGLTFQRVLEHRGPISDVAFDCRGRLHVLRGDGELGTYDPRTRSERWTRVATFWSRGDEVDPGRLLPDGDGVAVIGNTPARRDRLWLVRRGDGGRWRARHLFSDHDPDYWSGIDMGTLRVLPDGRIRLMVTPNMADYGVAECGYSKLFELTFALGGGRTAARDLGEGGEYRDDRLQQDLAGRWLLVVDGRASRWTTAELAERLAAPTPVTEPTTAAPAP